MEHITNGVINWIAITVIFVTIIGTIYFGRYNVGEARVAIVVECIMGMTITTYNCLYVVFKNNSPEYKKGKRNN